MPFLTLSTAAGQQTRVALGPGSPGARKLGRDDPPLDLPAAGASQDVSTAGQGGETVTVLLLPMDVLWDFVVKCKETCKTIYDTSTEET